MTRLSLEAVRNWWSGRRARPAARPSPAPTLNYAEQIKELVKDLITIEVNTIVKENMTAERMPTVPNALLDIARSYVRAFARLRIKIVPRNEPGAEEKATTGAPEVSLIPKGEEAEFFQLPRDKVSFGKLFKLLQLGAEQAHGRFRDSLAKSDVVLVERIADNSETLWFLLARYPGLAADDNEVSVTDIRGDTANFVPPPELTARDLLIIKKIWEVGTERVLAQTVVQLDGDIVTRIARDFRELAGDKDNGTDDKGAQLLALHQQGLHTAIGRWEALVQAATAVVNGITGGLAGRGTGGR